MKRFLIRALYFACVLATAPERAHAQRVPEGIHQDARGPSELCGLRGADVADLLNTARASKTLRPTPIESERFELFASEDSLMQLVFTRPTEAAYPAATCRRAFQVADGSWHHERTMRCEAGREACDSLFVEFQALDQRVAEALGGG